MADRSRTRSGEQAPSIMSLKPKRSFSAAKATHLVVRELDKALTGKTRIHRHDHHVIAEVQHLLDLGDRGVGVHGDTGALAEGLNRGECLDHVTLGLRMDIDDVRAGGGEKFNLAGRILDHKVHVDELVGGSSHGLDVFETHGEIGNETAVHHVAMEDVDAGGVEILDGRTQDCRSRRT